MAIELGTPQITGFVNVLFIIILVVIGVGIFIFAAWKIFQNMTYTYSVDVYKKIGDSEIQYVDKAKQVKLEGNYMFHYKSMNVYSPVIDSKYFRLKQSGGLLGKKTNLAFSIYMDGVSVFPMDVNVIKGSLVPINLDQFNYMQQRIKALAAKYVKTSQLMQLLPYLAVGGIILMFIVGMIFYTKHIENVSNSILSTVMRATEIAAQQTGQVQVITG